MSGAGIRPLQDMFQPRQVPKRTAAYDADQTAAAAAAHAPSAAQEANPAADLLIRTIRFANSD